MYKKLMLKDRLLSLLLLAALLPAAAPGQIQNAAEEVDVPPEHRAAPPNQQQPAAAPSLPPQDFAGPVPPSYPLFYQVALGPFALYSASHRIVHQVAPPAAA